MARIQTVTIWDPQRGAVRINASDYDPSTHELYDGQGETPPEPPVTFDASDPGQVEDPALRVEQTSVSPPWWKVLDADGEQVGKAHQNEADARQALRELIEAEPEG